MTMIKGTEEKIEIGDFVYLKSNLYSQLSAIGSKYNEPFNERLEVLDIQNEMVEIISVRGDKKVYDKKFLSHQNELQK